MTDNKPDPRVEKSLFIFCIGITVLLLASIPFMALTGFGAPSTGQHTGSVLNVETSGMIWKTTSVEVRSAYESSSTETFCVTPEDRNRFASKLQNLQETGERVQIEYRSDWFVPIWKCAGTEYITSIEVDNQ